MLPFNNAGIDITRNAKPIWSVETEDCKRDYMRQMSLWVCLGSYSVMFFIRWEGSLPTSSLTNGRSTK